MQEVPQEAYGGRGQSAAMTPGKPNHEEMSLSQQERPSSLPVSLNKSTNLTGQELNSELCLHLLLSPDNVSECKRLLKNSQAAKLTVGSDILGCGGNCFTHPELQTLHSCYWCVWCLETFTFSSDFYLSVCSLLLLSASAFGLCPSSFSL